MDIKGPMDSLIEMKRREVDRDWKNAEALQQMVKHLADISETNKAIVDLLSDIRAELGRD